MTIQFKKVVECFTFYNGKGEKVERETEIRFDPLTGETSRLVVDPGLVVTPNDYTKVAKETANENCPFCPENILRLTPLFPKEVSEQGRLYQGSATGFPNLFPYSKYNGVVVFSERHYIRLHEFTVPLMKDAFMVAQTYIQKVQLLDSTARYASINWNYLPISGGSIIHPHLHVIISETPTNYEAITYNHANRFKEQTGEPYSSALYQAETTINERWIGDYGNVTWMHAFAPKSHNDFIGFFKNIYSINEISEQDWIDFAKGVQALFQTLTEQQFFSFNLILSADPNESIPVHIRLIPRLTIGKLQTSDINFFQALHNEPLSYKIPEHVAAQARTYF